MSKNERVWCRVTSTTYKALELKQKQTGLSFSDMVRVALSDYLVDEISQVNREKQNSNDVVKVAA